MSEYTAVARTYAKASYSFAKEESVVEKWFEMMLFVDEVLKDKSLLSILKTNESKNKITSLLLSICDGFIDVYFENFLKLIIQNNRLSAFSYIVEYYKKLMDEDNNVLNVTLISANQLSKENIDKIVHFLEEKYKSTINLTKKIDSSLIGGFIIKTDKEVIDHSLKNKIENISNVLYY